MQTLQIDKNKAIKLFPKAAPEFQEMLKDTFGEKAFSQNIMDRVKTFEDACEVTGKDAGQLLKKWNANDDSLDEINYKKIKIITQALNEGWTPNWNNSNEYKYYPYFDMRSFGFSYVLYDFWYSNSDVGSRLCFKSEALAKYAGTQFNSEYKAFLTL